MLKNKKFKNNPGFSIAELVISAGIIAMISALVLANFRGSNQRAALDNEAERLSSIMRQANINSLIGLTVEGTRPAGGYGVHLITCSSNCSYQLFADINGDHLYSDTTDVLVQRFGMLDGNVYINQLTLPSSANQSNLDLVFVPPQGIIFINGTQTVTRAEITLGFKNTSYTRKVILDSKSGRVDIQ